MSRLRLLRALGLGAALAAASGAFARAQDRPPPAVSEDQRKALDEKRDALRAADEERQRIAAEIEALKGERGKLQAALIDAAGAIRQREPQVAERETRIAEMAESERQLKASLLARRDVLAEVIAALQRMGRQPPPALLVRPNDALEAVRSAILLGAVVPDMRAEAESLGSDLREMSRLKAMMTDERDELAGELADLGRERARLAALMDERQRRLGARETDLAGETARAQAIARDVKDLEELVARVEQEVAGARAAAEAAQAAAAAGRPAGDETRRKVDLAALHDATRLAPALPFAETRGMLPLPVAGQKLRDFGRPNGAGGAEQGLSLAARPGAPVTAPADGWVVYAGPFRSYGQLLILDAGGGYHILLAGMERITVGLKQFVLAGEPVAVMSGDPSGATPTAAAGAQKSVLYVEFRKDGGSIDPTPWWAGVPGEKVGG
ncbi:murein hydrolase activator EnvC family protein [Methylopila sp. Yamaguchi]|uniref:murein hydrolase activator EnvC family protein n=1 Tax=Methylopila sp. Yamaguchi TaxID=1437817 RepID=UPI000CAB3E9F|nr:peptidoglycan DD-metalloendopeptidase family protein [Methylopila sp. Yamaguchi]GBD47005.1 peptidase M23B [Methylopila sp. Yamaguchi]